MAGLFADWGRQDGGGDFSLSRRTNFYFFMGRSETMRISVRDCRRLRTRFHSCLPHPSLRDDDNFSDLPIAGNRTPNGAK